MLYEWSLDGYALILSFWYFDADRKTKMATIELYDWTKILLWPPSSDRVINIDMVQVGVFLTKLHIRKCERNK